MALETVALTPDEVVERGKALYEQHLQTKLHKGNIGKYLVIDIDSGDYEIGDEHLPTARRLRKRHPSASLYGMRIGYKAIASFGPALRPEEDC